MAVLPRRYGCRDGLMEVMAVLPRRYGCRRWLYCILPVRVNYRDLLHVTSRALSRPAGQVPWR